MPHSARSLRMLRRSKKLNSREDRAFRRSLVRRRAYQTEKKRRPSKKRSKSRSKKRWSKRRSRSRSFVTPTPAPSRRPRRSRKTRLPNSLREISLQLDRLRGALRSSDSVFEKLVLDTERSIGKFSNVAAANTEQFILQTAMSVFPNAFFSIPALSIEYHFLDNWADIQKLPGDYLVTLPELKRYKCDRMTKEQQMVDVSCADVVHPTAKLDYLLDSSNDDDIVVVRLSLTGHRTLRPHVTAGTNSHANLLVLDRKKMEVSIVEPNDPLDENEIHVNWFADLVELTLGDWFEENGFDFVGYSDNTCEFDHGSLCRYGSIYALLENRIVTDKLAFRKFVLLLLQTQASELLAKFTH